MPFQTIRVSVNKETQFLVQTKWIKGVEALTFCVLLADFHLMNLRTENCALRICMFIVFLIVIVVSAYFCGLHTGCYMDMIISTRD